MSSAEAGDRREGVVAEAQGGEAARSAAEELAERRASYLARFEAWLDRALAEEAEPAGLDASILGALASGESLDPKEDLYTLYEALTALAQEIKLQGRAFKDLSDAVSPLAERLETAASQHGEALAEARTIAEEALDTAKDLESVQVREIQDRCFRESLELLLDLRDRLARGAAAAEALHR